MAKKKKAAKKGRVISVDMTDVGASKIADGDYLGVVEKIEQEESQGGNDMLVFHIKAKGVTMWHYCVLQANALWNLRGTLEACGMEVPESSLDIDLDEVEGCELGITVENETYQGKKRPKIVDCFPVSELDEDSNEEGDEPDGDEGDESTEEEAGSDEIEVGSEVLCDDGDTGVVTAIDDDVVTVEVDGTDYELPLDSVSLVEGDEPDEPEEEEEEEEAEELELAKGCTVTFEDDGEEYTGVVTVLSKKKKTLSVEVDEEIWEMGTEDVVVTEEA